MEYTEKSNNTSSDEHPETNVYEVHLLGWIVDYDRHSEKVYYKHIDKFTWVSPTWYEVGWTGYITERVFDQKLVSTSRNNSVKIIPLIANKGFNSEIGHSILANPEVRDKVIEHIVEITSSRNYDGINIDFEGIDPNDREKLIEFVCLLSSKLHSLGKEVSIDVPAKTYKTYEGWSGAYDYAKLAECADYLVIMAYDYHWSGGEPGPISPLDWYKKVIEYTLKVVPREKIIIGIPVYGYDWTIGKKGVGVSYKECIEIAENYNVTIKFDNISGEAVFHYTDTSGKKHEVWFNTAESARLCIEIAQSYGINRIAFWRAGMEDPKFWEFIKRPDS